jgi:hypothetical protein
MIAAFGLLAGCREGERLERTVVSGRITYQGEAVKKGAIRFVPASGTEATVCNADVVDGQYAITGRGGVPVGKYKVEIVAFRLTKNAPPDHKMAPGARGGDPFAEQYIPEKYNSKTTLDLDVSAGNKKLTKDFELGL